MDRTFVTRIVRLSVGCEPGVSSVKLVQRVEYSVHALIADCMEYMECSKVLSVKDIHLPQLGY